jgi:regulator of cell morphogenesis and NO signaling
MKNFNKSQLVGDIVSMHLEAASVFKKHKIDFCCGGKKTLEEAVKETGNNLEEIIYELETENKTATKKINDIDFYKSKMSDLIEYIERKHHVYLRNTLPMISDYSNAILNAHGTSHMELFELHKSFNILKSELERHLVKEEKILFPLIIEFEIDERKDLLQEILKNINNLENEHEGAGDILKEMRKITNDYKVPDDGCVTYSLTFEKLKEMEYDLFDHIHLENNIIFRRFENMRLGG